MELRLFKLQQRNTHWSEVSEKLVVDSTEKVAEGLCGIGIAVCEVLGFQELAPFLVRCL
jgi:ribulose 1,5-bisphosphate synthetase/thiazole synthase